MATLNPGDPAPVFEAPDQDDNTVRLGDFEGRPLFIFFYPAFKTKWRLRDFVCVMPSTEPRITDTIGCLVLIFFYFWFLFRLFDHLMPWMGGNYKLSLKQYDDEKLLIWQGNNTADFEANLALFESVGLPIE